MDSFELNKIAGAVLGTLLAVMAIGVLGEALFHAETPEEPGWAVAVSEEGAAEGGAAEEQVTPLPVRLASADPDAGANIAKRCASCHSFEAGGPNKVGPALHNVVGRPIASHEGFSYSAAFQEKSGEGFEWTYEHLDGFLHSPRDYIPGTAMAFGGIKDPQDLADLIAYLRTQTENPPPLPEPQEEAPAEGGAEQPTLEGEQAEGEQPTEPEPQEEAAEQAAQSDAPTQQGEAQSGDAESVGTGTAGEAATPDTAPAQPAPTEESAASGAGTSETPDAQEEPANAQPADAQPAGEQPAEGEQPAANDQQGAAEPASGETTAAAGASGLVTEVAAADVEDGQAEARKCQACHSLEEGGPNRVGPHIYGVVGRQVASVEDYNYSDALKSVGGEWTIEQLDAFLADPRGFAKGTKMAFPGVKDDEKRHALVHYLYTLQENPQPLQ